MKSAAQMRKHILSYILVLFLFILLAMMGSQAVTVISQQSTMKNRTCIIIDAGHGGEDGGAVSCTGVFESNINLEIALKLNDLLHFLGMETKMIRTTDTAVGEGGATIAARKAADLRERVRLINSTENAVLVSIHQNKYPESRYSGAQVFYADTPGSKEFAYQMQKSFISTLNPGSNRSIKKTSGVYLMERIQCTGILLECGFLSNPREEALLRQSAYQRKLCAVIAANCSTFLFRNSNPLTAA